MQAKMETSAERYRRLKKEKEVLQDVECSECGMVWKCRKADLQFWVASGIIPSSLAAVMLNAVKAKGLNEADILGSLDLSEVAQSIKSTSDIVRYTAVEPRIVETVSDVNDIAQDEVMMCCYNFLRDWQMQGGGRAAALETFRQG